MAKWTRTSLKYQTVVKTSSVYMKSHLDCILGRPDIFMDTSRHFILVSFYMLQRFIYQNKTSFLPKWPQSNNTRNEFQTNIYIKSKIQILFTWKSHAGLKFHFGQNYRHEIHTGLSFILPQFIWTPAKSWLNAERRFSTKMKLHNGLSSFHLSCEGTVT